MAKRLNNRLYTVEKLGKVNGKWQYIRSQDGTLFSGPHRTKIKDEDLPPWYIFGRYYKLFGYMSVKGITDMRYIPNKVFNHFLKDDCLLISYGGVISEVEGGGNKLLLDRYSGYDEIIWGNEIISILKGARKFSNYDISPFIEQIRDKRDWLVTRYPEEFGPGRWKGDVDALFAENEDVN